MSESMTSCYPATTFEWNASLNYGDTHFSDISFSISLPVDFQLTNYIFMDYNGDGRRDLVWVEKFGTKRYLRYATFGKDLPNGMQEQFFSGTVSVVYQMLDDHKDAEPILEILDYNADGRQDLAVCLPTSRTSETCASWDLYLSEPNLSGTWYLSSNKIVLPFTSKNVKFGDIDTDGLLDAVEIGSSLKIYTLKRRVGANPSSNTYYAFTASPSIKPLIGAPIFTATPSQSETWGYSEAFLSDINGDGRLDVSIPVKEHYTPSTCSPTLCDPQKLKLYTFINNGNEYNYSSAYLITLGETSTTGTNLLKYPQIISQDFNNDGLSDLVYRDTLNWKYWLNRGNGFGSSAWITGNSIYEYTPPTINIFDINNDGYMDVIWHDRKNKQLKYRQWDKAEGGISTVDKLVSMDTVDSNNIPVYVDINGDGANEKIILTPGINTVNFNIKKGNTIPGHRVTGITNGNYFSTQIYYAPLSNSKHYTTLKGIMTPTNADTSHCFSYVPCPPQHYYSTAEFYTQLNLPFGQDYENKNPAPILELNGPIYLVTEVKQSAPVPSNFNSLNKTTYHYHHARSQAGGRGFLGFEKITITDHQSLISTETIYHQDWPRIGSPKSVAVKTKEGHKLSEKTFTMGTALNSVNSRIHCVYVDKTNEVSYGLKNNGATQGAILQTINSDTDYDDEGNAIRVETIISGSANTTRKLVNNEYSPDSWEKRMGRLLSVTTRTQRNNDPEIIRTSAFTYYGRSDFWPGLLKTEIVDPGVNQQVIEYAYDDVGNKRQTTKTAQVKPGVNQTRKTVIEYDTSKRFAKTTKDSLGNVTSGVLKYHSVFGLPEEIRDVNGRVTTIKYNQQGQEYQRSDATGAWTHINRDYCAVTAACPMGARYRTEALVSGGGRTVEYFDVAGRIVRKSQILFDGRESHVDTEYDALSRVARQSMPFVNSETPYWTVYEYDILGRVTKVTAPDGTVTTTTYDGYKTIVTADANGKKLQRTEERNSIGHLVKVTDNLGGTITYGYDALGNMTSATTVADGKTVKVQMCYDSLGRKFAMHDPDKGGFLGNATMTCSTLASYLAQSAANKPVGWWFYRYNDFGELIEQTDTKKQATVMDYDALGRMVTRTDKLANGGVDTHTRWYYDKNIGEATAQLKTQ